VVVTVPVVGVMQVIADQIIGMIAMGHSLVPAVRPVTVLRVMQTTGMLRRAPAGVGAIDCDSALDNLGAMLLVEVSIVQIVDMVLMPNRCMATFRSVHMRVVLTYFAGNHVYPSGAWRRGTVPPRRSTRILYE